MPTKEIVEARKLPDFGDELEPVNLDGISNVTDGPGPKEIAAVAEAVGFEKRDPDQTPPATVPAFVLTAPPLMNDGTAIYQVRKKASKEPRVNITLNVTETQKGRFTALRDHHFGTTSNELLKIAMDALMREMARESGDTPTE